MTCKLNPDALMESIGIDDYVIDYEASVVYLPEAEYLKLVRYFSKNKQASEFEEGGWRWVCCERFPAGKNKYELRREG